MRKAGVGWEWERDENVLEFNVINLDDDKDLKHLKSFFKKQFAILNQSEKRQLYTHFTTNTDTYLMQMIIKAIW